MTAMLTRRMLAPVSAVIAAVATVLAAPAPPAQAAPCPAAELVFARGRLEAPGAGQIGYALADALRKKTGKNTALYAVNYPANTEVDIGANDMSQHIQRTIASCPDTKIVVGGYSLGAAVADVVLAVPMMAFTFRNPLPAGAEDHIAAVTLFGNGIQWVGPIGAFSPVYRDRTIELCHGDDPICNPTDPNNWQTYWPDHLAPAYIKAGMINQAADFAAGRL
jgi:cutinase